MVQMNRSEHDHESTYQAGRDRNDQDASSSAPGDRSAEYEGTAAHNSKIVVLSDIHIGDGGPTCWYQSAVHERHLLGILEWVIDHRDEVRELVLLGDVVDLWTYPFGQRPPEFAAIVAANPRLFGAHGAFSQVLDALDGAVTWIPGNHDMGITPAEAAIIRSQRGHTLRLIDGLLYQPLGPDPRVLMSHGHHHTLFNAFDPHSPWAGLPSGHFVTRAVAEHWHRQLAPGQTVADLPGQGSPNGLDLTGMAGALAGLDGSLVIGMLLDYLVATLDISDDDPILMPDGTTATLADARGAYHDVWSRWADSEGGGKQGQLDAARAADGDAMERLGWFAQADGFTYGADVVVMGHTHGAVERLANSTVGYVNAGFECPSAADLDDRPITFAVVDVGKAVNGDVSAQVAGEVWEAVDVSGTIVCRPTSGRVEDISRFGTMDFSTYVDIDNRGGGTDLVLIEATVTSGRFVNEPGASIAAGSRQRVWVADNLGPFGSDVELRYRRPDGTELTIEASCPTGLMPNRCTSSVTFVARSGTSDWGAPNAVRRTGHPLFVFIDAANPA